MDQLQGDLLPPRTAPSTVLLQVATDRPAAVLLVDGASRLIVHANPLARQLAPELVLPCSVDDWTAAVGVRDAQGNALSEVDRRSWLTADQPTGYGQAVSVGQLPDWSGSRRSFYALPLPVGDAPGLGGHHFVVLLALQTLGVPAGLDHTVAPPPFVQDHAVLAAGCSFSLVSATEPDLPLTWVNAAFTALTGYTAEEVIGRNCRFLQGPSTEPDQVALISEHLKAGQDVTAVMLNYRKDGTVFCNQVSISPVLDETGAVTHYFGVQTDVTHRVEADQARALALAAERAARADAESTRRTAHVFGLRMSLVAEATGLLASTLDVGESLERLARLVVPLLADWVVISLADEHGRSTCRPIIRHRDGHEGAIEAYRALLPDLPRPGSQAHELLGGGPGQLLPRWSAPPASQLSAAERELLAIEQAFGSSSRLVVPLTARRKVVGTMMLVHGPSGRTFDESDLDLAADLGLRAGLAIDNARMYTREQTTAVTLQRSLLPSRPHIDGLALAAEYLPADQGSQVGGDWWDVFQLPDGAIGLVIGDVMGHDIAAAAAMGQLRSILRTCAWGGAEPAAVLTQLDDLVQSFELAQLATCFYAKLEWAGAEPGGNRPARLSWSIAGHLPPIVLDPEGRARLLDMGTDVPIGVPFAGAREQHDTVLAAGSTLLLYTDGLVETRAGDIYGDVDRLLRKVGGQPAADCPKSLVDHLLAGLPALSDDVALLAVKILDEAPCTQ